MFSLLRWIGKSISYVIFPFQSEWNWYQDHSWYWPESRRFIPYLHPKINVTIDSRETHNWVERILNGKGGHDEGLCNKIRQYTITNHKPVEMDTQEAAFLAAVAYSMDNNPKQWPFYIKLTDAMLADRIKAEDELNKSIWDFDYAVSSRLNEQERRLKENENVALLNDFLKKNR